MTVISQIKCIGNHDKWWLSVSISHIVPFLCGCRKNASFTIFVIVTPKEGLADSAPPILFEPTYICWACSDIWCHTKRRIGAAPPANISFCMTTTKIIKDAFLRHIPHSVIVGLVIALELHWADPSNRSMMRWMWVSWMNKCSVKCEDPLFFNKTKHDAIGLNAICGASR